MQHNSLGVAFARSRTGTKLRTELQRDDEQKWEWMISRKQAAQSAESSVARPDKEKWEWAGPKTEAASNTGSNDSRPVLPRGSVVQQSGTKLAVMATRSVAVQTEDPICGALSLWDWLTSATVTSTATQTLDDGRSPHHWRSIQRQYWLELQKVQHNIQSALNKRRDSGRSSSSHSPTAMLEQVKERLHNIAHYMYILNGELWRRNCALLLGADAEVRRRKGVERSGKG